MTHDIRELAERRVDYLRKNNRDVSLDYVIQESGYGKWAIILYTEYNFKLMGFDIIESDTSWKRPEAIKEYNQFIDDGYCVAVYVPREVKEEVRRKLTRNGGRENIHLMTTDKLLPLIRA